MNYRVKEIVTYKAELWKVIKATSEKELTDLSGQENRGEGFNLYTLQKPDKRTALAWEYELDKENS